MLADPPLQGRVEFRGKIVLLVRRLGAAVEGAAEAGGGSIVLGAEPAVRLGGPRIARAALQMIDADIPGHPRTRGELPLDVAGWRLREIVGEQRIAYLAVAVGAAGVAA